MNDHECECGCGCDHEHAEAWELEFNIRLQPGAFAANAKLMLRVVKEAAKRGLKTLAFADDTLAGGAPCGSIAEHPAFKAALKEAKRKFLADVKKIPHAPKVAFAPAEAEAFIDKAGPDARFPFCGSAEEVWSRQVTGLARRLAAIGCKDAVVGLSGGLDSALALLVTEAAFRLLDLDPKGIHVYTMPGFGTTARTRGNADLLAEGLGLKLETIDITPVCRQHFKDIGQPADRHDVTFENAQARVRTLILMDKANMYNGIVVGTGDMSEIALGWCTYNGDHMSMFGVNAGVPKTVVREVCRTWAESVDPEGDEGPRKAAKALFDILETPVSPELLPAKNGEIVQKTEDRVGPYELHDFFLWHFTAGRKTPEQLLALAKKAFKGVYDAKTVKKWLDVFLRRLCTQAFKRNCAPDGVRVFSVYFGPDAWHVPSDLSPSALI